MLDDGVPRLLPTCPYPDSAHHIDRGSAEEATLDQAGEGALLKANANTVGFDYE